MERSILVVEDSRTQAERLRLLLEMAGHRVRVAGNGREGLEAVRTATPDLIISDVVMPEMDGYAFCRAVKSDERTKRIPFVLLTSRSTPLDIIKGLERGADNFITKPFEDDYLLERIRRIFEHLEYREQGHLELEVSIQVGARKIVLSADKQQIIELLFSTFEELCELNRQLVEARRTVEGHARELEQKVAERTETLRRTEAQYRGIFENAPVGIFQTLPDGRIIAANPAAARIFGYPSPAALIAEITDLKSQVYVDAQQRAALLARLEADGSVTGFEVRVRRRDGSQIWISTSARTLRDAAGGVVGYEAMLEDITERKEVEAENARLYAEVREAHDFFQSVAQNSSDAIGATDLHGRLTYLSPAVEEMLGYRPEEMIGVRIADLYRNGLEEARGVMRRLAAEGRIKSHDSALRARDGRWVEVSASVSPLRDATGAMTGTVAVIRDVTDRHRTEQALRQSEKLAAMGSLLAGVAHELNNPLAVVLGQSRLLEEQADSPFAERATSITRAAQRCARIVKNFLALARQHPAERERVQLEQIIREAVELLAYQLRVDNVEMRLDLASDLPPLWADPHQLHQVLVNLITNAHHALHQAPLPRRITLATRFEPERAMAVLDVADNGPGIPPEIRPRLFEPFFTTKPPGQGTGLGLSLCQGIVENHQGTIRAGEAAGGGALFRIEIPVTSAVMDSGKPAAAPAAAIAAKKILVVDDDVEIAEFLAELLELDGHQVEQASNGAVALEKLAAGNFDIVMSDFRMPDLDGPGLYRKLGELGFPLRSRFVFITGDLLGAETHTFLEHTGALYIAKPFTRDDVRRVVAAASR